MMPQQEPTPQLHARKMRGESLSETEETTLQVWYAEQDAAESAELSSTAEPSQSNLRAEVNDALLRLQTVTQQIQQLSEENEAIRRENAALAHQVMHATKAA